MVIRTEARVHPTSGATIHATVTDPAHIHVFNAETGERLRSSAEVPADSVQVASGQSAG
jgi:multiple sugar transport system ATP-binding protein